MSGNRQEKTARIAQFCKFYSIYNKEKYMNRDTITGAALLCIALFLAAVANSGAI